MTYRRTGPSGIGGWLAFFIVTLAGNALVSFFLAIGSASRLVRGPELWPGVFATLAVFGAARVVGYGYLIWLLVSRREPRTPGRVIMGLWVLALVAPLAIAVTAALSGAGFTLAWSMLGNGAAVVRPVVYAGVWTAYLLRSERVTETYTFAGQAAHDATAAVFE